MGGESYTLVGVLVVAVSALAGVVAYLAKGWITSYKEQQTRDDAYHAEQNTIIREVVTVLESLKHLIADIPDKAGSIVKTDGDRTREKIDEVVRHITEIKSSGKT